MWPARPIRNACTAVRAVTAPSAKKSAEGCKKATAGEPSRLRVKCDEEPRNSKVACPVMPDRTPTKKKTPAKPRRAKAVERPPAKVGMATQLAAIQDRYRRAMTAALDHPHREQGDLIRIALAALLAEKAALGVADGQETAEALES